VNTAVRVSSAPPPRGLLAAAVVLLVVAALGMAALMRLGLLTFAGTAAPSVRYQSDVAPGPPARWGFDDIPAGQVPSDAVRFGEPLFGTWSVRPETDAPSPPHAMCQSGLAEFPALSLGPALYTDLQMATRFKPVSGRVDQAAGLIFRVQDERNYYVLRANALERNVNFYRYSAGDAARWRKGRSRSLPVAGTRCVWRCAAPSFAGTLTTGRSSPPRMQRSQRGRSASGPRPTPTPALTMWRYDHCAKSCVRDACRTFSGMRA